MSGEPVEVLVIEDSPSFANEISVYMRASDIPHRITNVLTLTEGLNQLRMNSWGLVILDLLLPNGQGTDVAVRVCAAAGEATPVLVISHLDDPEIRLAVESLRVTEFLPKSIVDQDSFLRDVRCALRRGEACGWACEARRALSDAAEVIQKIQSA